MQVVLQTDAVDQAELLLQPVGVVFLGVVQLQRQHVAGRVVAVLFGQRDALGQRGAHLVLQRQIVAQHVRHSVPRIDRLRRHVRGAFEKEDALQQRIGVLRLLLHLVIDALVELAEAPVGVHPRMQEILIARRQFAAQQLLQIVDYRCLALHCVFPMSDAPSTAGKHPR